MAGVTDRPVRVLCRRLGAGMAISEMIHSDTSLWDTKKSDRRLDIQDEPGPISVQIAGYDPQMMAKAARANEERGADIIDINLGCPAKKVLKKAAGSALMRDEALCAEIFRQVVNSVQIPVTVKMRTGWDHLSKNGPVIAKMAESLGLQAVTMHGRTRCDMYKGDAEYDTIQRTREAIQIPLIANGDITSTEKAHEVLSTTGADAVMIGSLFAGTDETPGKLIKKNGKLFKSFRGMGSVGAMNKGSADRYFQTKQKDTSKYVPEGVEGFVKYKGDVGSIIFKLIGGLKSSMGYLGSKNIVKLRNKPQFVKITKAGFYESMVHNVDIVKNDNKY